MIRRQQRGRRPTKKGVIKELTINRLSAGGDGLAGDISVPYTIPGETVRASVNGKIGRPVDIINSAENRMAPSCPHFGLPGEGCGGCHLQHLGLKGTLDWKTDLLRNTLNRVGLTAPEIMVHQSPLKSRRRARLAMLRTGKGWKVGFRQWRSYQIVPMHECAILAPQLFECARTLTNEAHRILPDEVKSGELFMTLTDQGIDADISGFDEARLDLTHREALAELVNKHDLARLTIGLVPAAQVREPQMYFDGLSVSLPSGSFLQATDDGQFFLTAQVLAAVKNASHVADLFAGLGTFASPVSQNATVLAVDSDGPAMEALTKAARQSRRKIDTQTRDLFDFPLSVKELSEFDAVILDPPRAGAEAQAAILAQSTVPIVVSVSCHAESFARDSQTLSERYELISIAMLDQFIFSPHIEVVGVFRLREA